MRATYADPTTDIKWKGDATGLEDLYIVGLEPQRLIKDFDSTKWNDYSWQDLQYYAELGTFDNCARLKAVLLQKQMMDPKLRDEMCCLIYLLHKSAKHPQDSQVTLCSIQGYRQGKSDPTYTTFHVHPGTKALSAQEKDLWKKAIAKAGQTHLREAKPVKEPLQVVKQALEPSSNVEIVESIDDDTDSEDITVPAAGGLFGKNPQSAAAAAPRPPFRRVRRTQAATAVQAAQAATAVQAAQAATPRRNTHPSDDEDNSEISDPSDDEYDLDNAGKRQKRNAKGGNNEKKLRRELQQAQEQIKQKDKELAAAQECNKNLQESLLQRATEKARQTVTGTTVTGSQHVDTAIETPSHPTTKTTTPAAPDQERYKETCNSLPQRNLNQQFREVDNLNWSETILNNLPFDPLLIVNAVSFFIWFVMCRWCHQRIFVEDPVVVEQFSEEFQPLIKAVAKSMKDCPPMTVSSPAIFVYVFGIPIWFVICLLLLLPLARRHGQMRAILAISKNIQGCGNTMCGLAITLIVITACVMGMVYFFTDLEDFLNNQYKLTSGAEQCKMRIHENKELLTWIPLHTRTNVDQCTNQFNNVANENWDFSTGDYPIDYRSEICNFLIKEMDSFESAQTLNSWYKWTMTSLFIASLAIVCYFLCRKKPHKFKRGDTVRKKNGTIWSYNDCYVHSQQRDDKGNPTYTIAMFKDLRNVEEGIYSEDELKHKDELK